MYNQIDVIEFMTVDLLKNFHQSQMSYRIYVDKSVYYVKKII